MQESDYINTSEWLSKHENDFKPPISSKTMFNQQLMQIFVKGPNDRKDFHIENGEEIFYMVNGSMNLRILSDNEFKSILIKEGEIFILPSCVLHSPQRLEGSLGFVIERQRDATDEFDGLLYFNEPTTNIKYEIYSHIENLETQLRELAIKARENADKKNSQCSENRKDPPIKPRCNLNLVYPISLGNYIKENESLIESVKCVSLYSNEYKSKVHIMSNGKFDIMNNFDTIIWMFKGEASLIVDSQVISLQASDFYRVKSGKKVTISIPSKQLAIKISMDPAQ